MFQKSKRKYILILVSLKYVCFDLSEQIKTSRADEALSFPETSTTDR